MKGLKYHILNSMHIIHLVSVIIVTFVLFTACEEQGYEAEYQDGYPSKLAGNWIAFDYQLEKDNYRTALDTINDFDLQTSDGFDKFLNLLTLTAVSDQYDMATALDPADTSKIIINNIYNLGIRTRAPHNRQKFEIRLGEQLDFLNQNGFNISFVSLSGQLVEGKEGDILFMVVGLYDSEKALLESLLISAYRKTGFEDTEYQSLLNK